MLYMYESLSLFKEDQSTNKQDVPIIGRQTPQVLTAFRNSSAPAFLNEVLFKLSQAQRTPSVSEISALFKV